MNQQEKILYHQIHPIKLMADWLPAPLSAYLLWQRQLAKGLIVGVVPGVIVTAILLHSANLEPYKDSSVGRYIKVYMTPQMEMLRLAGQFVVWLAAWYRKPAFIPAGFAMTLYGWFNGIIFPQRP